MTVFISEKYILTSDYGGVTLFSANDLASQACDLAIDANSK